MNLRTYKGISPRIAATTYVDSAAVVIGDVEIGEDSSIWPCTVVRGDVHRIRIGARSNVQDGAILHVAHEGPYSPGYPLLIGDDVTIGHAAIVHACIVGDACLIGAGAMVSPGKQVGEGELWIGSPARFARKLSDDEIERLYYSARQYVQLKNDYLAG